MLKLSMQAIIHEKFGDGIMSNFGRHDELDKAHRLRACAELVGVFK